MKSKEICPYCKKEIVRNLNFCSNCGQELFGVKDSEKVGAYWNAANEEAREWSKQSKIYAEKKKQEELMHRKQSLSVKLLIAVIIIIGVFSVYKVQNYQSQMINQVKQQLIGKTMKTHSTHMEGLGWIYHEYYQLTFKDNDTLDYAYIETVGPASDEEQPRYQGTYSYTISLSLMGEYTVKVNGDTYKLNVNDENKPTSISH